jgi:predicted nucleic acid-binding Zn ribbon protein
MIYHFTCLDCKQRVSVNHPMSAPHPEFHAECGGRLARIYLPVNIVYHGSGYYSTDKVLGTPTKDEIYDAENPGYRLE